MDIGRSIKTKLFFLLMVIGAIPFIIIITFAAVNMISQMEDVVKKNGLLRNSIVSEHVTELLEKNFYVLHSAALNPMILQFVKYPSNERYQDIYKILKETNHIFNDTNLMALTAADANQLMRTDGSELVNLSNRRHFQEAMQGNDFVSDIILSMSTNKMIVVLEVPIKDENNKPVGMIQRNLNLVALQKFVEMQGTKESSVIVVDRNGRVIAHSDGIKSHKDEKMLNRYEFILEAMDKDSGIIRLNIDKEDSLACCSRNALTGWTIITVQPYHYILDQVYSTIFKATAIGFLMLIIVSAAAYFLSVKVTKPIIDITKAAGKIVSGNDNIDKLEIHSNDELGQMASAFNKMRSSRDAYQLESELDKLTRLYNKMKIEKLCKMKLEAYVQQENNNTYMALYIIDLDHFKEANDTFGHQFGDKVLIEFSKVLKNNFRPNDCIGRFGGDEFVVMIDKLPNTDIIFRKAKTINQLACDLAIDEVPARISASIGIAIVPQNGTDYDTLFQAADTALYYVKKNGRNNYHCEIPD